MEPILEEGGRSERSLDLDLDVAAAGDTKRDLTFRAGFLSLQERLSNWKRQSRNIKDYQYHRRTDEDVDTVGGRQQRRRQTTGVTDEQFANLYEFFQSKTSYKKQLEQEAEMRASKRPKIPIMKLSKEDWNVKCWEERARGLPPPRHYYHHQDQNNQNNNQLRELVGSNNRLQKPELKAAVFNGRVDEVAKKLEKVRVGQPLDELLYKLATNKLHNQRREHSWTDQLKHELSQGMHDRKRLKSKILEQQQQTVSDGSLVRLGPGGGGQEDKRVVQAKSALGRPIRRLFDDDDDD